MFVLDASVTASWLFPDEVSDYAESVLNLLRRRRALVPSVWTLEMANTLVVGERRQRLTTDKSADFVRLLQDLPITVAAASTPPRMGPLLALARDHNLSSYDAAYLHLAIEDGLQLATQDIKLKSAAERVGVWLPALDEPADGIDGVQS